MSVCQNEHGLLLIDMWPIDGCDKANNTTRHFQFLRESDGSLRCTDCYAGMPTKWLKLPTTTQSFVGIGISVASISNGKGQLFAA
jgi:hypothetical protein